MLHRQRQSVGFAVIKGDYGNAINDLEINQFS
jgi:hypothetical protein